jgi:outer membrane protein OmpA-like peptidoglycan-associated protein
MGPGGPPGDPAFSGSFGPPPAAAPPAPKADDAEERARTLAEQNSLTGSTGLMRTAYAGSGAAGTFRVGFLMDWFTASGFLCNSNTFCDPQANSDKTNHIGGWFSLNATPVSFLEAYAGIRTYANSNTLGSPSLLQVLGDTTLGLKAFTPFRVGDIFTAGGDLRVLLLNGAGDVGVSGGGTSAEFNALTSLDMREIRGKGVGAPVRIHLNLGYRLDNSGKLVRSVEELRAQRNPTLAGGLSRIPVSRIERFGLGINRVDFFHIRFGVDVPYRWVQPYIEYSVDVPINRQGYECHTRTLSLGDACLALKDITNPNSGPPGFSAAPSRITLGARTNPLWGAFRGLSGHLAFDIGVSGKSTFIEEVAPQAPWTLYLGIGYAFDTKEKELPPAPPVLPPPVPEVIPPPPEYYVRGVVKEKGTTAAVAKAIVTVKTGAAEPPYATDGTGRFLTRKMDPGTHTLEISADGYKTGTCTATITPAAAPAQPAAPGFPGAPPGMPGAPPGMPVAPPGMPVAPPGMPGAPPGMPGAPPGMPGAPGGPPIAPAPQPKLTGSFYTDVTCEIESLPKKGSISGTVSSSEGGGNVAGVQITLKDAKGGSHSATTGPDGSFKFGDLPPGEASLKAEQKDHFNHVHETTVRPREDVKANMVLTKRPAQASVRVVGDQITITKQIHFETDSAVILGDSDQLLEEIADVMNKNVNLKKIEIQGHTDNTGTPQHNKDLSQARADSVRTWLVSRGNVDGSRLIAKGYGQERPLVPNVTPANRARNRRVQFLIVER